MRTHSDGDVARAANEYHKEGLLNATKPKRFLMNLMESWDVVIIGGEQNSNVAHATIGQRAGIVMMRKKITNS